MAVCVPRLCAHAEAGTRSVVAQTHTPPKHPTMQRGRKRSPHRQRPAMLGTFLSNDATTTSPSARPPAAAPPPCCLCRPAATAPASTSASSLSSAIALPPPPPPATTWLASCGRIWCSAGLGAEPAAGCSRCSSSPPSCSPSSPSSSPSPSSSLAPPSAPPSASCCAPAPAATTAARPRHRLAVVESCGRRAAGKPSNTRNAEPLLRRSLPRAWGRCLKRPAPPATHRGQHLHGQPVARVHVPAHPRQVAVAVRTLLHLLLRLPLALCPLLF